MQPLVALEKQLSALPDPTLQVVPVSVDTEELQWMEEWYKSKNREPFVSDLQIVPTQIYSLGEGRR